MQQKLSLIRRLLIVQTVLLAGISTIGGYAATATDMEAMGGPTALLPMVIILGVGAALALILGWQVRWMALALSASGAGALSLDAWLLRRRDRQLTMA
ncbi:MAG TPA: DoxX family membrane protein [Gammaproteobacteria bacterium]|nr:DoxX family membrane protein [Gammaproteobacteria bacterium]